MILKIEKTSVVGSGYVGISFAVLLDQNNEVVVLDDQHDTFEWFDVCKVANGSEFHNYIKSYSSWIISREMQ
jgi:Trk K+ transport system NAD-binding subunit